MYSTRPKKIPRSVPFRFTMDKRVIFFVPFHSVRLARFRVNVYKFFIYREIHRSIEREASAEFSSRRSKKGLPEATKRLPKDAVHSIMKRRKYK